MRNKKHLIIGCLLLGTKIYSSDDGASYRNQVFAYIRSFPLQPDLTTDLELTKRQADFLKKIDMKRFPIGTKSPLIYAIETDRVHVALFLIDHVYVDINRIDAPGDYTPLSTAIWRKNIKMVQVLLSRSPDLDRTDVYGKTALDWAKYEARRKGWSDPQTYTKTLAIAQMLRVSRK